MNSVRPILEQIANARGEIGIVVHMNQSFYSQPDINERVNTLRKYIGSYNHAGIRHKEVGTEEAVLVLDSKTAPEIIGAMAKEHGSVFYDVFLTDNDGKRIGKTAGEYDLMSKDESVFAFIEFGEMMERFRMIPDSVRLQFNAFMRRRGCKIEGTRA